MRRFIPGLGLSVGVALASLGVAQVETSVFGRAVFEALVVAILIGMTVRSLWTPSDSFAPGIDFAAKEILEVAVLLLGASVDLPLLLRAGPALAIGIVLLVVVGLAISYCIGRALRLPHRLAVLIACGNSICGNSAIAAVAPVIGAERDHVASAIAFTAILGVGVVVGLPFLLQPLDLNHYQYGVLAGLTVYSVPQVLAAAFPVSVLSGQVGTLVKLVRVLMLGPVVLFFTLSHRRGVLQSVRVPGGAAAAPSRFPLTKAIPWFIAGFILLAGARSAGLISESAAATTKAFSSSLTILAMAALGLGVDLRTIRKVGAPVVATVSISLLTLLGLSVMLIRLLDLG